MRRKKRKNETSQNSSELIETEESPIIRTNHEPINIQMNTQDNTLSLSQWDQANINQTTEAVVFQEDSDEDTEKTEQNIYCFSNKLDNKKFEQCYPGVSISVVSTSDGILCIEPGSETKTQFHSNQAYYVMQRGGKAVLSLKGNISLHRVGDIIKIPPGKHFIHI